LANIFSEKLKKRLARRTLNDLKKKEQSLFKRGDIHNMSFRSLPKLIYPEIDKKLITWVEELESRGAILSDELIRNKAIQIGNELKYTAFKSSKGWLECFKNRHNLKLRKLHGESYANRAINFDELLDTLREKIRAYKEENVYNADETGIFYKLIPSKSVCILTRSGHKLLKDRLSILLCTNMTGTKKLKPLVIGRYKKPRCFKNFPVQNFVDYISSQRSWMTSSIFNQWLMTWDMVLQKDESKILLVVDNCPAHKIQVSLRNIEIYFLPPNLTSTVQPLDQGIIHAMKTKFNGHKIRDLIEKIEGGADVYECYKKINMKDAIMFLSKAWDEIKSETINNCFTHAKWRVSQTSQEEVLESNELIIQEFFHISSLTDPLPADDFNQIDFTENDAILDEINQSDATNVAIFENDDINESNDDTPYETKIVTKHECVADLQKIKDYFNQKHYNSKALEGIKSIRNEIETVEPFNFKLWYINKN